jgi:hypothetical protein
MITLDADDDIRIFTAGAWMAGSSQVKPGHEDRRRGRKETDQQLPL